MQEGCSWEATASVGVAERLEGADDDAFEFALVDRDMVSQWL